MATRAGHGWWPYLGPFLVFMGFTELAPRLPESVTSVATLFIKPLATAACVFYFFRQGAYPELRGYAWRSFGWLVDVAVGVALAALWMVPYFWIPELRPADVSGGFDPAVLGAEFVPVAIAVRLIGYAGVTPIFEELFMRSFVIRLGEVWGSGVARLAPGTKGVSVRLARGFEMLGAGPARDFREVPIGFFSGKSFVVVVVIFTVTHVPWEWWVMLPWAVLSTLWLYHRKHLMAVVLLHAGSNGAILLFAAALGGTLPTGWGGPLPLWFFV